MKTRKELGALSKAELVDQCLVQQATIAQLEARVAELERRLDQNSRNSHKPPSSDGFRKPPSPTRREQQAAGRRPGGQVGHEGKTLAMADAPDHTKVVWPEACRACSTALTGAGRLVGRGQVHDLPVVKLDVTEWQLMERICPGCGKACRAEWPAGVGPGARYGSRLKAWMVYLPVQHLLPWERTTQVLNDLVGVRVGEGTMATALAHCAAGVGPALEAIKQAIIAAPVGHFDETGARVAGRLMWWHTASTQQMTYYAIDAKRGRAAHAQIGILPHFRGVACLDAYESYFGYDCEHALCNAHSLRELTGVLDATGQTWAQTLADLLREIYHGIKTNAAAPSEAEQMANRLRYRTLVQDGQLANPVGFHQLSKNRRLKRTHAQRLLVRLAEHEDDYLRFMTDPAIPFDNNPAERDLRMMKVQQKVSGCFRTEAGAATFSAIRSSTTSVRKNSADILDALAAVFDGHPLMPADLIPAE